MKNFYFINSYTKVGYFSQNISYGGIFNKEELSVFESPYPQNNNLFQYNQNNQVYSIIYTKNHSFIPEIFLKPSRQKTRLVGSDIEAKGITEEIFELFMKEKLPSNISINILPFDEFKIIHSRFGAWSDGILGFSINGNDKNIFVRENHLDALLIVIGHEIGHVLTDTLPNKHDEEAKAFAFSIEWARIIKENNIANLGLSIKDKLDFQPARNGLHDIAFSFVDLMVKRGRKAIELHEDLVRKYVSVFDKIYC